MCWWDQAGFLFSGIENRLKLYIVIAFIQRMPDFMPGNLIFS